MSVCLYVTGEPPPVIADQLGGFAAMFGRHAMLAARGFEIVDGRASPDLSPASFSGLIITGSPASVIDDEPWMRHAVSIIHRFADHGVPVLGVCFGHQLIAKAFGGTVRRADAGLMSSTHAVELREAGARDPLFVGIPVRFDANLSHRDEVTTSEAMTVLADGPHSVAAIAVGDAVRGVQFHPEFGGREARAYVDQKTEELGAAAATLREQARDTPEAARVISNFLTEFVDKS